MPMTRHITGLSIILITALLMPPSAGAAPKAMEAELTAPPQANMMASPAPAELRYPPIRLDLVDSVLSDPQKEVKKELIEGSQVFEDALHNNGAIYRDPALEKALNEAIPVEQLGERAKGFYYRIYVVKDPRLNAMTVPTGSIYIFSGILAAINNMDELRMVLAHEVNHILDQDVVHRFKKFKQEVGAIRFAQLVAAPAIAVAIGESSDANTATAIAYAYTAANISISISYQLAFLGYGRENENECDQYAMNLLYEHEYDVNHAQLFFQTMEREQKQYGKGFQTHFLQDHETDKQRAERVAKFMKEKGIQPPSGTPAKDMEYHRLTHEVRIENARLNIKTKRPRHAVEDLEELGELFPEDVRVPQLLGDAYALTAQDADILKAELSGDAWRKMNIKDKKKQQEAWAKKAEEYYLETIKRDPSHADAYKSLGFLEEDLLKYTAAKSNLEKYLTMKSDATDARFVKSRIEKIDRKVKAEGEKAQVKTKKGTA